MTNNMSISTHVIFDLGDTLNDASVIVVILKEYARNKNKRLTMDLTIYPEIESISEFLKDFLVNIGDDSHKYPDKFIEFQKMIISKLLEQDISMMPGVDKLIKHLHQNNIPMAIATNATQHVTKVVIDKTIGLDPALFSHFVAGGDDPEVKNNKPAPDIYFVCANRFKPPPKSMDSCVVFEDSIRGISGALATGMKTVLINKKPVHEIGAIADKITVIVVSLENFRPESVGLPPYV